jgi:4-hydroxybutyrate dehydrogenase/sulfolactaldehyde 3-reductase
MTLEDTLADVVGFIGLGNMGGPMASNLVRKGFEVIAFDLADKALAAVVAEGATAALSAAEVAKRSDVVFTMLPNSPHVQSTVEGDILPNLRPGGVVVDMSTIDPNVTDRVVAATTKAGFGFVDAPVGRTTGHAQRGESLFMVGAEDKDFQRVLPMLNAMGNKVIHCGPPASGIRVKIVNNFLAISLCQLNAEALTLGAALGLDIEVELEVLNGTTATNGFLQTAYPAKTLSGDIEPGFQIDLAHKDLTIAIEAANRLNRAKGLYLININQPLLGSTRSKLRRETGNLAKIPGY